MRDPALEAFGLSGVRWFRAIAGRRWPHTDSDQCPDRRAL